MKTITANDIPAKFRFILDMYKATDRWVRNRNNRIPSYEFFKLIAIKQFDVFIDNSFLWPNNEIGLWIAIRKQNEPEILRLTAELEGKEKTEQASDMDRFIELYKSFGIEIERPPLQINKEYYISLHDDIDERFEAYSGVRFNSSGKFISQGFYE
ncbi:MAG TPA: hypothetical protein DF296_13710 [Candidatus Margulisbacteria bacterium]|nr:hypothetical protein [Candidatus Margulisiibacteriota bacterium]